MILPRQLQTHILQYAVCALESGEHSLEDLLRAGFTIPQLDELRTLPAPEFANIPSSAHPFLITYQVNGEELDKALRLLKRRREVARLQTEFLLRGAPTGMMVDLFNLSGRQVASLRRLLGMDVQRGRIKMPDDAVRKAVRKQWLELDGTEVERYLVLSERFPKLTLAQLYSIVNDTNPGGEKS